MLPRYLFATASGVAVTLGLFLLMQGLIESDRSPFTEGVTGRIVDFVRVEEDIDIPQKDRKPEPPPEPPEPPTHLPKPEFDGGRDSLGIDITPGDKGPTIDIRPGDFSDGEALPIVKVTPVYPSQAKRRGIQGYALVEFVVTKNGSVRDPKVIESSPPRVFDRASIAAALKFKYKPKVVNGQPIALSGVRNLFTYELTDG
ncbi:MAG: energy transducer TonB [Gammaproteobacteria bacterium]|nr:energy transducer TonB [Gammaproteobacteria bacterium]